jgi:low affinity Fe/Cu permease
MAPDQQPSRAIHVINRMTSAVGSIPALVVAVAVIVVWAASGPLFGFSDTWQLIINTFTTLVTFVMVFVIQNSQNRDGRAIQVKLDEILHVMKNADSRFVGVEDLPEKQIKELQDRLHHAGASDEAPPEKSPRQRAKASSS